MIENLKKNTLYIVSCETLEKKTLFTSFIRFCFGYLSKNKPTHIINHSALLFHNKDNWLICEIGYSKEQYYIISESNLNNQIMHFHEIGKINEEEKAYILKKYCHKRTQNALKKEFYSLTSFLFSYPYPVWTALASFEIEKFKFITNIINYMLNIIRDINKLILHSILQFKMTKFCSQSVIETINELNCNRMKNRKPLLYFSKSLYDLLQDLDFNIEEITPQDIYNCLTKID